MHFNTHISLYGQLSETLRMTFESEAELCDLLSLENYHTDAQRIAVAKLLRQDRFSRRLNVISGGNSRAPKLMKTERESKRETEGETERETVQMQIGQLVKLTKCHFLFFENKHTPCAPEIIRRPTNRNGSRRWAPGGRTTIDGRTAAHTHSGGTLVF